MYLRIKDTEHGEMYKCCSCNAWFRKQPDSIGAVSNYGIYCKDCSEELSHIEIEMWKGYMKEHGMADRKKLDEIGHKIWYEIGLSKEAKEAINGQG